MIARERRIDMFAFRPGSAMFRNYLLGLEADGWHATSVVRARSADTASREAVVVTAERKVATPRLRPAVPRRKRAA